MTDHINHIEYLNLLANIHPDTTLITPNRRLSATLRKLYQKYQIERQNKYWQTPDILPISRWIQRLWSDYTSKEFAQIPLLLNAAQEQFLWEKILLNSKESAPLLQVSETADMAKSAWGLLKQWQVNINHPLFNPMFKCAEDYAALHHWAVQFQKICHDQNWIENASLPDMVAAKIKSHEIKPARRIMLAGFNELSPQLKHLLTVSEDSGSAVTCMTLSQGMTDADCGRLSTMDSEDEIVTLARFAKSTLEMNSSASIGCVIPALNKIRDRVLQIFSDVFAPENTSTVDIQSCPFNISAGRNLLQYPIINTALQLLALQKKNISREAFSYLLVSPFVGDAEIERVKRAHYDNLLRKRNVNSIDLNKLIAKTEDKKQIALANLALINHCPKLSKRVSLFLSQTKENNELNTYSEWAILFNQLLSALGWPGERSLSSEEYQIIESWLTLLNETMSLDPVSKPVNYHQALQTLHKMARNTVFQPKTPEAPIQVLGLLEAASLPFDYLWVTGMDDLSWPPQPKPNPFIPKQLQRELCMPHATAERELIYCEQLTQQFKRSAKHVIFSHAEKNEECELQPSPLIQDLPIIRIDELKLQAYQPPSERIYQTKNAERILDEKAPDLLTQEKIYGGTDIIKQQALCPFKAFATHRLHARELEEPLPGLRPKDRGTLIHKILELLWNKLQTHAMLVGMDEDELNKLINSCVNETLNSFPNSRSEYTQYISLEKQRLHKLIYNWLQIEKERMPFKVSTNEKASEIILNHLHISIRIDRIDELPDGKKLIIDYKTGKKNDINHWFSDRPEEPQLPLYSLVDPENTAGITFAQLFPGENEFKGVSQYPLKMKGIKLVSEIKKVTAGTSQLKLLSWDQQLTQWNTVLTKLSDDFYYGIAKVDPKDPPETCRWCALKPLCRINDEACISDDN